MQRDIRDLTRISALDALPRLLSLAAAETARLLNITDLAAPFQVSRPTIRDYVTLLERVFLLETLPPWHSNRLSRLVKTPKMHLGDSGLACALLGIDSAALAADRTLLGQLLTTSFFRSCGDNRAGATSQSRSFTFATRIGAEVDIVMERGCARGSWELK